MELIIKNSNDITYQELEILFELYKYNNKKNIGKSSHSCKLKQMEENEYKEKWIKAVMENKSLIGFICVEEGNLIGFAFMTLNENENYINEMHIIDAKQKDGITFRTLINSIFQNSQVDKDFTGRIWQENYHAKRIFKSMGALPKDGKYRLSYKKVQEWINNPSSYQENSDLQN